MHRLPSRFSRCLLCTFALLSAAAVRAQQASAPEISPNTWTESVVYSFPSDGANQGPIGQLIQAPDGNFWGTTNQTGTSQMGSIFKITAAGVFTDVHDFTGPDGAFPYGALYIGLDGSVYGTDLGDKDTGGTDNYGTIFKVTMAGQFSVLHTFTTEVALYAGLVQDSAGNFYGIGSAGGGYGLGWIFKYTSGGSLEDVYDCQTVDCGGSRASLLQASDGNFYGTSAAYGSRDQGDVFEYTPGRGVQTLETFNGVLQAEPLSGLVELADGSLWGTTLSGGQSNGTYIGKGTIYDLVPDGSGGWNLNLADVLGTAPGPTLPWSGTLTLGGDGNLYGTSDEGANGSNGYSGDVYQVVPSTAAITSLYYLQGNPDAEFPYSNAIESADGNLWGVAVYGGVSNAGSIYKVVPSTPITPAIVLTSSATALSVGGSATLSYSVNNAHSLTAQNCSAFTNGTSGGAFTGALSTSGTFTFTPTENGTYLFAYSCGGAESATVTVTAGPAITATGLTLTPDPVTTGAAVSLKATVTSATGTPTGAVSFHVGPNLLGTCTLAGGICSLSEAASVPTGNYSITATYEGTSAYASSSQTATLTVNPIATQTAFSITPDPVASGANAALKAVVSASSGTPTGTVSFHVGPNVLGSCTLSSGTCTLMETASVPAGSYNITATYSGSATDTTSSANAIAVVR